MNREFQSSAEYHPQRSGIQYFRVAIVGLSFLFLNAAHAQTANFVLGTTNLLVGPAAGSNSVVLGVTPATAAWTNAANASWLHLSPANQTGIGSTNIIFSYDANPGATRSATLAIASQTLTITQAGSTYIAAEPVTTLLNTAGAFFPWAVALDAAANLYFTEWEFGSGSPVLLCKRAAADGTLTTLVGGTWLNHPEALAIDAAGDIYIGANSDYTDGYISKWTANSLVTTWASLSSPRGLAMDASGNLYIADELDGVIKEWNLTNSTFVTLVSSGLYLPCSVAADNAGNIYIADTGNSAIKEWIAVGNNVITLVSSNLMSPQALAVDGAGNVYVADTQNHAIKRWSAVAGSLTTFVDANSFGQFSGLVGIAVDGADNVYVTDSGDNAIIEVPHAFVDPTAKLENSSGGNDSLPPVLPPTENLLTPFAPVTDEPWLTITGITNGIVSFSIAANSGIPRVAHINLLGKLISIVQVSAGAPPDLIAIPGGIGMFQFAFGDAQFGPFSVLSTTNAFLPLTNWTVIGTASNIGPNLFEFTDTNPAIDLQRYYRVRAP